MFFDSLVGWAEICVEHARLQPLLWWLGRQRADQEDLIICVARLVVQKLWLPLTCDDLRAGSIASRNKLRFKSLFGGVFSILGRFWEVLGRPRGFENRFLGWFLAMLFSSAFWHRFWMDFWRSQTWKIAIFLRKNNDFHKIDVFEKGVKKHWFWLHFQR